MNNKKLLALLLSILMVLSLFTACGSAKSAAYDVATGEYAPAEEYAAAYDTGMYYDGDAYEETDFERGDAAGGISNGTAKQTSSAEMKAEKIIYTANAELETTDYEGAVEGIMALTARYGGFMESTSVSGSNYYTYSRGGKHLRSASFTIRIPAESFKEFTGTLSELGNVPYLNTASENITASYYDTESRMKAYRTQEERLIEMLAIAESVEDMLAIQQQLTEVQYQLDSLQSRLTNYDRQVSYSTVYLGISEVEEYTAPPAPVQKGYWEKMSDGFLDSLEDVKDFFTDLFLWLISNLPAIVAWVLGIYLVVKLICGIVRKNSRSGNKPRKTRKERRAERKARKAAKKEARRNAKKQAKSTPASEAVPAAETVPVAEAAPVDEPAPAVEPAPEAQTEEKQE